MLDRNRRIKSGPERFQSSNDKFDIIITCEERVYDQVIEGNYFFVLEYILFQNYIFDWICMLKFVRIK